MANRLTRTVLALLGAVALLGACGNDKPDGSPSSAAPENLRAPAAEVATGLETIRQLAADIAAAAGTDKAKAATLLEQIEPAWKKIEGTIKANDQDAYLTFEDAFAALGKAAEEGDSAKASKASNDVSTASSAYLARYPG
jgi:hypothetical protein